MRNPYSFVHEQSAGVVAELRDQDVMHVDVSHTPPGTPVILSVEIRSAEGAEHFLAIVRVTPRGAELLPCEGELRSLKPLSIESMAGHPPGRLEAHAAVRWARAVVPLIDSPEDPRTMKVWSRWIAASSGAIRNWCHTAGISPRRSLVFGRLLRAVSLSDGGRHKPENVLDVVDRRTLVGMLKRAGLGSDGTFPRTLEAFLEQQKLVPDADTLLEVARVIREYESGRALLRQGEATPPGDRAESSTTRTSASATIGVMPTHIVNRGIR